MKIEYNNLYTHFVFTTFRRLKIIPEKNRERIEKYITGIVNNNDSKMYTIYANPEHLHFLISKAPNISEQRIASVIANGSEILSMIIIWQYLVISHGKIQHPHFLFPRTMLTKPVNTF